MAMDAKGLTAVVDTGYHKHIKASEDGQGTMLQTAKITKANADQRAGRVGRMAAGIVYRLYTEVMYTAMDAHAENQFFMVPPFGQILKVASLRLDPAALLGIEATRFAAISSTLRGYQLVDAAGYPTEFGRNVSKLPLDIPFGSFLYVVQVERVYIAQHPALFFEKKETTYYYFRQQKKSTQETGLAKYPLTLCILCGRDDFFSCYFI